MVDLLRQGGGFIPQLVFLSACHSGSMIPAELLQGLNDGMLKESSDTKTLDLALERKGYSGTALELLRIGVKQVVGMRYAVGDNYARRLARDFYRYLLAEGYSTDAALASARRGLAETLEHKAELFAVDHATPLLFGSQTLSIIPHKKAQSAI